MRSGSYKVNVAHHGWPCSYKMASVLTTELEATPDFDHRTAPTQRQEDTSKLQDFKMFFVVVSEDFLTNFRPKEFL